MARQENRITACSKYDAVIEKCFQRAEPKTDTGPLMQGEIMIMTFSFAYHIHTFNLQLVIGHSNVFLFLNSLEDGDISARILDCKPYMYDCHECGWCPECHTCSSP